MHNALVVGVGQRFGHAAADRQHQWQRQQAARQGVALDVAAGHRLHCQPGQLAVDAGVVQGHDAGVDEAARRLGAAQEGCARGALAGGR